MGNHYSWEKGCDDGNCGNAKSYCAQLFKTNTDPSESIVIVSSGGSWPSPDLLQYFLNCDANNRSLPCPTALNIADQSCIDPCPSRQSYLFDPMAIEAGKECRNNTGGENWTSDTMALAVVISYEVCLQRIADLASGMSFPVSLKDRDGNPMTVRNQMDVALDMWPEFYHFYNNSYGKADVDAFLKRYSDAGAPLPPAAVTVLQNNFSDQNQRLYGLLNEFDFALQLDIKFAQAVQGGNEAIPPVNNPNAIISYYQQQQLLVPQNGGGYAYYTGPLMDLFKACYWRKTLNDSNFSHDFSEYGSPFWTAAQRQDAYRLALGSVFKKGTTISGGQDWIDIWGQAYGDAGLIEGGRSADSYEDPVDVPGMTNPYEGTDQGKWDGLLPHKPEEDFASDMIVRETVDTTLHGYKNECDSKTMIEEILPIGCALIVGGVSSMIIPGQLSKVVAAGLGGVSAYEVVSSVYGSQALMWWRTTRRNDGEKTAAVLISAGFPAAFAMGMVELGYIPSAIDTFPKKFLLVGAFGGIGFGLLHATLRDSLISGGNAAEAILSPISWLDGFLHSIFDGCDRHTGNSTLQCYCENANSKPLLSNALVEDIYGCTEQQATLRNECMYAAMTTGDWGSDPVHMGVCDPSNGWMDSPTACISAGEFAYQQWNPSMNPKAANMWNQISHCVDPTNPSFLPPADADSVCVKQYGTYARAGGIILAGGTTDRYPVPGVVAGKCYDFRAPIGQQELGVDNSYDWSQIEQPKSGCFIM